jgi:hypothetical protein
MGLAPKDVWLWSDPDHPIVPLYAPAVKLLGQAGLHSAQKNEYLRG